METTGKAVAQLTLNQTRQQQPGFSSEEQVHSYPPSPHQSGSYGGMNHRPSLPKMSFPVFTGENPRIWKDKAYITSAFLICLKEFGFSMHQ
jgi:hypothetical protein